MSAISGKRLMRSVAYIPVEDIVPGPLQPRVNFPADELEELSQSISCHGVLQPLTVRVRGDRFELIAGERRLRASKMAGLFEVPCIVMDVDMEKSGIIALIENIQRSNLDFVEEAEGISRLIKLFGMSQDAAAKALGKSQSAVANKLRILRLSPDVLGRIRAESLTERHARALLRLEDAETQRMALDFIIDQRMTVSSSEEYIDRLTCTRREQEPAPTRKKPFFIMKDLRLFMNSLNRSLDVMRQGGIDADLVRNETEKELILTVKIPKK